MIYAVYGFVAGFLIPYMSRRFAKFMPATPAYALYRLVKPNKTARKVKFSTRYKQLKRKYLSRSLVYGALSALLSLLAFWRLGEEHLFWYLTFVWILLLLAEIDLKMLLLPDILTIPLLIGGFVFAAFFGVNVSAEESAAAAMASVASDNIPPTTGTAPEMTVLPTLTASRSAEPASRFEIDKNAVNTIRIALKPHESSLPMPLESSDKRLCSKSAPAAAVPIMQ